MQKINWFWIALIAVLTISPSSSADEFDVIYLGGQSNMEGFGYVKELSEEQRKGMNGGFIFHAPASLDQTAVGGKGSWLPLQPGHGTGFQYENGKAKYSDRFGLEWSFARTILEKRPNRRLALIKYARNGSSIHRKAAGNFGCWDPDFESEVGEQRNINQYDHFLATIRNATTPADIDQDGKIDTLNPIGILWMQGESDAAYTPEIAEAYEQNLKRLMDLVRASLRVDDLPVVIGRISDSKKNDKGKVWAEGDRVRQAQSDFVAKDKAARLVTSTDRYSYSDPWHYDTAGYLDLGKEFANALLEMQNP